MTESSNKIVIDNNSLVNFFNYYFFDRDYDNRVYEKLKDFLFSKIMSGEIVVIDKVFDEFQFINNRREFMELKKLMKPYVRGTLSLTIHVQELIKKYYIPENETFYRGNKVAIDREMDEYVSKNADLYLVAYCNNLKDEKPLLVTDESFRRGNKLVHKIPYICKGENINCLDLPSSLFNHYKTELVFTLNGIS